MRRPTVCALPSCAGAILASEPRVRCVWQNEVYGSQPAVPSRTIATFHDRCWRQIELALDGLEAELAELPGQM